MKHLSITCWAACRLAETNGNMMQLRGTSDLQLLSRALVLSRTHLERHACNSADLLQMLTSFARVQFLPDEEWLELHEACAVRLARQGLLSPAAISGILNGYRGLRCYPRTLINVLRGMMADMQEERQRRSDRVEDEAVAELEDEECETSDEMLR